MKDKREVTVVMAKCRQTKKAYGIRAEKDRSGVWIFTWAFPLNEKSASNEGYDKVRINGQITHDTEFPGCPYCGTPHWVSCGACKKITCWSPDQATFTCGWCGNSGKVRTGETFDLKGGDI